MHVLYSDWLRFSCVCVPWVFRRRKIAFLSLVFMTLTIVVSCVALHSYLKSSDARGAAVLSRSKRSGGVDSFSELAVAPLLRPTSPSKKLNLLILTNSSPHDEKHRHLRQTIRSTWGNCSRARINCMVVFFVGLTSDEALDSAIRQEAYVHQDMLLCRILDRYEDLTRKFLCALEWVSSLEFDFLLKTDDDVYVDVSRLIAYLSGVPKYGFYGGAVYQGSVTRNIDGRHYLSKDDYAPSYFPPFCKGLMYVLSPELPKLILEKSRSIKVFNVDDAYVGVVLHNASIVPTSIDNFLATKYLWVLFSALDLCWFRRWIGVGDSLSPGQMLDIHSALQVPLLSGACLNLTYLSFLLLHAMVCLCLIVLWRCNAWRSRHAVPLKVELGA